MRKTDKIFSVFACLVAMTVIFAIGTQIGIHKGRMLGYDEAFSHAQEVVDQDLRAELDTCKTWVNGLGADLMKANKIIREGC